MVLNYVDYIVNTPPFLTLWCIQGRYVTCFLFDKNTHTGFFSDTGGTRSFKLCMIIILFRVLHIHIMFDDLTLVSRSQVCQRHKLQTGFLDSCPV